MKKSIILAALALMGMLAFSEPITRASLEKNIAKFMGNTNGCLTFSATIGGTTWTCFIPRTAIQSANVMEIEGSPVALFQGSFQLVGVCTPGFAFADVDGIDEKSEAGVGIRINDVSVDASGNIVFSKK